MSSIEPFHKTFGISMREWIDKIPNELDHDIVFLESIIPVGREGFGLNGDMLEDFVKQSILGLLNKGGSFFVDDSVAEEWKKINTINANNDALVTQIIDTWLRSEYEPDWYSMWFEKP